MGLAVKAAGDDQVALRGGAGNRADVAMQRVGVARGIKGAKVPKPLLHFLC